jgi:hypothetical protein
MLKWYYKEVLLSAREESRRLTLKMTAPQYVRQSRLALLRVRLDRPVGRGRYADWSPAVRRFTLYLHPSNSVGVILQYLVRNISMKTTGTSADFDQRYQTHLKHLMLNGLQPKTIARPTICLGQQCVGPRSTRPSTDRRLRSAPPRSIVGHQHAQM